MAVINHRLDLDAFSREANALHHVSQIRVPARVALCYQTPGDLKFKQRIVDLNKLEAENKFIASHPEYNWWISQATLKPGASDRKIGSILTFNALFLDIDILHPPTKLNSKQRQRHNDILGRLHSQGPEDLARVLLIDIEESDLPPPSMIIWTGGGIQVKWRFDLPIPFQSRPRWQSAQQFLAERLISYGWPVDLKAIDASRLLRAIGTINQRWNEPVRILYEDKANDLPFDELADIILPYSREEVHAFRAKMSRQKQIQASPKNICRKFRRPESACIDEAVRTLWARRFEFAMAVLKERADKSGIPEGCRNNWFWPVANALAYSCTGYEDLVEHLAALHQDLFASRGSQWSVTEAQNSASAVLQRMQKSGRKDLYQMRTETFLGFLDISDEERKKYSKLLGSGKRHASHNEGVMGFPTMKGLPYEKYREETRRRQAEGGRYAANKRAEANLALREKAKLLHDQGMSLRAISKDVGVSHETVRKWLSQ